MDAAEHLHLIEALGLRIPIRCQDRNAHHRLKVCYGDGFLSSPSEHSPSLQAGIEGKGPWTIRIEGRSPVVQEEFPEAIRTFNHELLHGLMLRTPEHFFVHAGVFAIEGRVVVLPGLSQAGKSTLVTAAIFRGADYLSDELFVFDPGTRQAIPFPRALKIRDVCVPYFPSAQENYVGEGEGRFLSLGSFERDVVARASKVAAVVVPAYVGQGPTRLEPITAGEAFLALTSSALNFGSHRESSLDHLASIVDDTMCFRVSWNDPHRALTLIEDALCPSPSMSRRPPMSS